MNKSVDGMKYEGSADKPHKLSKGGVQQLLKEGRKERRDARPVGSMTFRQLLFYALFWKGFVPNNGKIAWVLLVGVGFAFILVK